MSEIEDVVDLHVIWWMSREKAQEKGQSKWAKFAWEEEKRLTCKTDGKNIEPLCWANCDGDKSPENSSVAIRSVGLS